MNHMTDEQRKKLKKKFLEYFKEVPMQGLSANYIGVHPDTITDWKKNDPDFSDSIDRLRAEYAREKLTTVKSPEWILERLFKPEFAQRSPLLDEEGKPIPLLSGLNALHNNNSTKETDETK